MIRVLVSEFVKSQMSFAVGRTTVQPSWVGEGRPHNRRSEGEVEGAAEENDTDGSTEDWLCQDRSGT